MFLRIFVVLLTLLPSVALAQSGEAALHSPNGQLAITFRTVTISPGEDGDARKVETVPAGGQLVYQVTFHGKPVMEPSSLRLDLTGHPPLGANVRIANFAAENGKQENYRLITGKASSVHDRYNALRLDVEEPTGRKLTMEARAYDDAIAFRYVVPAQADLQEFRLAKERTEFRISKDPFIYAMILPNFRSMYEGEFVKLSASSLSNQGGVESHMLVGLPLLMEVPGVAWMAITEADVRGYASMYVTNPSGGWASHKFESVLAPHLDDANTAVVGDLPHHSAWRVLLIGDEPGRLVESNAVTSLNPESAIADTSWIHAGKASWDWWSGSLDPNGKPAYTTDNMKYYVDFAAQSGFEYMLIDAGWSVRGDITKMNGKIDVPEVVRYASSKNVKVWIWLTYSETEKQMQEAFPLYAKWGVAGLKIDFVERDDQGGIDWYYRVAELAAQHHLMLDFHGPTKPTGVERTYPNILGYEAVAGMEQSKAGSRDNPDHQTTLPFTRMLAGPIDYTPGGFNNVTKAEFQSRTLAPMVMGTRARQLAMYVVYQAAFQMVSDHPAAYKNQPAFEFIKAAPATWDETRVIDGSPARYVVIARRHGKEWFIGGMTNWDAREIDVPLSFLDAGQYRAEIYRDGPDADRQPKNVEVTNQTVDRTMHLKARLASGGGYAVRLVPVQR
jgi:alpha-glucosidase